MEIYVIYNAIKSSFDIMQAKPGYLTRFYALFGGVGLWFVLFLLQSFGLYVMAKNKNLKNRWMAFVPFVNILYIGRIVGECKIFNRRVKRAGMYAMITQIALTIMCALLVASELYLYLEVGEPTRVLYQGYYMLDWQTTGFAAKVEEFYAFGEYFLSIFQLIYEIMMFIMLITLFRNYSPKNHTLLTVLSIFIPLSRYVIIFVLRKNKVVDYNAYVCAQREEYIRRHQAQYGNPNINPYGTPYGQPFNQTYRPAGQTAKPDEDPFEEFSSQPKTQTNSSDEFFTE